MRKSRKRVSRKRKSSSRKRVPLERRRVSRKRQSRQRVIRARRKSIKKHIRYRVGDSAAKAWESTRDRQIKFPQSLTFGTHDFLSYSGIREAVLEPEEREARQRHLRTVRAQIMTHGGCTVRGRARQQQEMAALKQKHEAERRELHAELNRKNKKELAVLHKNKKEAQAAYKEAQAALERFLKNRDSQYQFY